MTIFDVSIDAPTGGVTDLDRHRGPVPPVVNVASHHGPTPRSGTQSAHRQPGPAAEIDVSEPVRPGREPVPAVVRPLLR
ncbi:hypothetical protein [Actinoplanes palleronii]|uniref:Uncharacterized protein n=1 Tax=Actinoplanes palleronii TaxID=113570 RepID=A0ABQ4B2V0_9ACTN|nr:hypothetical protein [Actinoplanes palleronii]GIE64921.1 hypothetical protein Apa02nite_010290 [Actinoplanes palleronii]